MPVAKKTFTYIDLFAGCGGLSLGLESRGGELIVAVERSSMAAETFFHNLINPIRQSSDWSSYLETSIDDQVASRLLVDELGKLLNRRDLVQALSTKSPDVVVGGPPCQGFSLAGRRNPEDKRNQLPWQFLELVEKTSPKMVVIENVVGMRHKFSPEQKESVFDQLQQALRETGSGYEVQAVEVNALHYGAPQHRPRLMIIGLRKDIALSLAIASTNQLWKSNFRDLCGEVPPLAPIPQVTSAEVRTVADALTGLLDPRKVPETKSAKAYKSLMDDDELWHVTKKDSRVLANHKNRNHQAHAVDRFRIYQILANNNIDPKVLSTAANLSEKEAKAFLREALKDVSYPCISPDGVQVASTIDEFLAAAWASRTKKHSQRVLRLDSPSKTVVTIGDDYVHPLEPRTFTVRELARFQGFPNAFEFRAKETTGGLNRRNEVPQYSQVGNAVSPFLALAVGDLINSILGGQTKRAIKI